MHSITDRAVVLRSSRYEDRHLVITALTEHHGKVTAMARSAIQSRRFGAALEMFALGTWDWSSREGAELLTLKTADLVHDFSQLPRDMNRFSIASLLTEVVLRGTPHDDHSPELFKLLVNGLVALEKSSGSSPTPGIFLATRFLLKYLHWAGQFPKFITCVHCGTPPWQADSAALGLSIDPAGILCSQCVSPGSKVSASLLTQLLHFHSRPISESPETLESGGGEAVALLYRLVEILQFHVPGFDRSPLRSLRSLQVFNPEIPETFA